MKDVKIINIEDPVSAEKAIAHQRSVAKMGLEERVAIITGGSRYWSGNRPNWQSRAAGSP